MILAKAPIQRYRASMPKSATDSFSFRCLLLIQNTLRPTMLMVIAPFEEFNAAAMSFQPSALRGMLLQPTHDNRTHHVSKRQWHANKKSS
mmetsp:Transcript_1810/g.4524  ORF Transcript_1810/g.4524 Transcript_1810/m.4524 type:complete len:90 (-) Transcript_1810:1519-1788(-)